MSKLDNQWSNCSLVPSPIYIFLRKAEWEPGNEASLTMRDRNHKFTQAIARTVSAQTSLTRGEGMATLVHTLGLALEFESDQY